MSFLEGEPRSATAKALTEVKAVIIRQGQREKLLKTVPSWLNVLIKDLSTSLRHLNAEFLHLQAEHAAQKKRLDAIDGMHSRKAS
jgi:CRP-like cAMP-binding protein